MVPMMTGLLRLPQHRAHGTSLVIIIFVASAGLAGYWFTENVDWSLAGWLALGSAVGAYMGATAMSRIGPRLLRAIFGVFLLVVAIRLLII